MKDIKSFLNNFKKENKKNNFIKNWKFEEVEETEKLEKMEEIDLGFISLT